MDNPTFTIYDDNGRERLTVDLPWKWEICSECQGEGKSSAYLGSFSGEEMRDDPEFAEAYFAGHYDRSCGPCKGMGKVKEINIEKMKPKLKRRYLTHLREEAEYRRECEMERRMGA